jgi:hypothetical protein
MDLDLKEVEAVETLLARVDQAAAEQLLNLQLAYSAGGLGETAI